MNRKSSEICFAVLGDTHFCMPELREKTKNNFFFAGDTPDHVRYAAMKNTLLKPLLQKIKNLNPDFIISTGDFVEGGLTDREDTAKEMKNALNFISEYTDNIPFLIAIGTHEHPRAFREAVLPRIASHAENAIENYYKYSIKNADFLFLDYLRYKQDEQQDIWLEENLARSAEKNRKIFVIAHPPLFTWGRHFFNEPDFSARLTQLFRKYPVDVYFCGHTHNQCMSFHEISEKGRGYLQVMASSVGYPKSQTLPLSDFHCIASYSQKDRFLWGIPEDFSPGFFMVRVSENNINIEWHSVNCNFASISVSNRRLETEKIVFPQFEKAEHTFNPSDKIQIKFGCIYIYAMTESTENTEAVFNGVKLGKIPHNPSYAGRRFIPLDKTALRSIREENNLTLKLPPENNFIIGSISLELILYDNRIIRSDVVPELFIHKEKIKGNFSFPILTKSEKGEKVNIKLILKKV